MPAKAGRHGRGMGRRGIAGGGVSRGGMERVLARLLREPRGFFRPAEWRP